MAARSQAASWCRIIAIIVGSATNQDGKSNGKLACYLQNAAGTTTDYDGTGAHTLAANNWYLLHLTYSASVGLAAYVNR